jgi:hypothetical protein
LFFNNLVICHIESSGSQLSLFRPFLPSRCCGLNFGPLWIPSGHQDEHQNHQRNDKIKSIRMRRDLVSSLPGHRAKVSFPVRLLNAARRFWRAASKSRHSRAPPREEVLGEGPGACEKKESETPRARYASSERRADGRSPCAKRWPSERKKDGFTDTHSTAPQCIIVNELSFFIAHPTTEGAPLSYSSRDLPGDETALRTKNQILKTRDDHAPVILSNPESQT